MAICVTTTTHTSHICVVCVTLASMDNELRNQITNEIDNGLLDGVKQIKNILRRNDGVKDQDKINAFNSLVSASTLKQDRNNTNEPNLMVHQRAMEYLVGAFAGLSKLANIPFEQPQRAMLATTSPDADDVELPTLQVEVRQKDMQAVQNTQPSQQNILPDYAQNIVPPRSIEVRLSRLQKYEDNE